MWNRFVTEYSYNEIEKKIIEIELDKISDNII
jgi:hypothetical protein